MTKLTLDQLTTGDETLYIIAHAGGMEMGIGTADEIHQLVNDGILPDSIVMTLAN